ncbi:hypothetical protein RirG_002120 [Rhizophagus irregularis DAOM 197198w]|uniref:Uncharacterized protein n=1 Tax=Rhizophagus irregularis (strain DAOM 197198w) TaxID=1432141 RepID=A0A015IQA1_RHIIW|nr:hypothetical protein RirG_189480 [Rhizophagus irregularis DAOM 197198w]EXX79800.1 hypothetical protein RirG_002120 [Rhizophagus irregularis DAOM 197198w]
MKNKKKSYENFLTNFYDVPYEATKVSIHIRISLPRLTRSKIKSKSYQKLIEGKNGRGNLDYGIESVQLGEKLA